MYRENLKEFSLNTINVALDAILNLKNTLDFDVIANASEKIAKSSGSVIISGCGSSGSSANRGVCTFNFVYKPAHYLSPADSFHGDFGMIKKGDIYMPISKGGNTKELVEAIPIAKKLGAYVIAITAGKNSQIEKMSDLCILFEPGKEADYGLEMVATTSTTISCLILDILAINVLKLNNIGPNEFKLIHPGGAVGDMLK